MTIRLLMISLLLATGICMRPHRIQAQDAPAGPDDATHDELRALRDSALKAFNDRDIDALLTHLHPDVVVTFQNAEVCRGHDEVREFHRRMSEGDQREVQSMESRFEVDELSILYGDDTAIAFGTMQDDFELSNGMAFTLDSRWTATMVREDDRWLVAALHASTDMFDNGVQDLMLKWNAVKYGASGAVVGLLIAGLLAFRICRRRKPGGAETA